MQARKQIIDALELMQQPAFLVAGGQIIYRNTAAGKFLLEAGTDVTALLETGREEYEHFTDGQLYLTLRLADMSVGCCITKSEDCEIWTPEQPADHAQLQALALAAQILREPLSAAISATEQLFPTLDAENESSQYQAAQINRRLFQMLRTISNMSDAAIYTDAGMSHMEYVEICAIVREILDKVSALTDGIDIHLEVEIPDQSIFTLADPEKLERAIYNLISNAIKFSPNGGKVRVQVSTPGKQLRLSVENEGNDLPSKDLYTRYLRHPGLYDSRWGLGLGMVLVRTAASQHGGAVLVDHPTPNTNRITMSLAMRQPKIPHFRSPILRLEYAGERDHGLIELADVLPPQKYKVDEI